MVSTRRKALLWLGVAAVVVVAIVWLRSPREMLVAPGWRVRVVGEDGRPCSGVKVLRCWAHYSLSSEYHCDERATRSDGAVAFEPRFVVMTPAAEVRGAVRSFRAFRFEASYGANSFVMVERPVGRGAVTLRPEDLVEEVVVECIKPATHGGAPLP